MTRLLRHYVKGQRQNIIQKGNTRESLFADDTDYVFYLDRLQDVVQRHEVKTLAIVLMTHHVHGPVNLCIEEGIPKLKAGQNWKD